MASPSLPPRLLCFSCALREATQTPHPCSSPALPLAELAHKPASDTTQEEAPPADSPSRTVSLQPETLPEAAASASAGCAAGDAPVAAAPCPAAAAEAVAVGTIRRLAHILLDKPWVAQQLTAEVNAILAARSAGGAGAAAPSGNSSVFGAPGLAALAPAAAAAATPTPFANLSGVPWEDDGDGAGSQQLAGKWRCSWAERLASLVGSAPLGSAPSMPAGPSAPPAPPAAGTAAVLRPGQLEVAAWRGGASLPLPSTPPTSELACEPSGLLPPGSIAPAASAAGEQLIATVPAQHALAACPTQPGPALHQPWQPSALAAAAGILAAMAQKQAAKDQQPSTVPGGGGEVVPRAAVGAAQRQAATKRPREEEQLSQQAKLALLLQRFRAAQRVKAPAQVPKLG